MALGRYAVTRYGKPWRVVVVRDVGELPGPAPVDCVAAAPAPVLVGKVEPIKAPAVVLDVAPVVAGAPCRMDAKTAALLARVNPAAESEPEPGADLPPYTLPPDGFDRWPTDKRAGWIGRNWGDLKRYGELAGEKAEERLEECRARS